MKTWLLYWLTVQVPKALAVGSSTQTDAGISIPNPLSCDSVVGCVHVLMNAISWIAIPVVSVMILFGGFQILFSSGNEEKVSQGKRTIVYAIVGYAIILLADAVVVVIQAVLTNPVPPDPPTP